MPKPDLIFITGCNAAGKSSLIRTHLSLFSDFEIIMTDVYKGRSKEIFKDAVFGGKNIILETPFNNEGFKNQMIMKFEQDTLVEYKSNDFVFVQKFAEYSFYLERLTKKDFDTISTNKNYESEFVKNISHKTFKW
ncbi:MAG TPA: hypothetical protein VL832_23740 [Puia sp.]|nr:hypothetical protein [Puia sp.]